MMAGISLTRTTHLKGSAGELREAVTNPVSLRGIVAVVAGAAVLLLPGIATGLVQTVVLLALAGSGVADGAFAVTGRRQLARPGNRWLAMVRAVVTLGCAALLTVVAVRAESSGAGLAVVVVVTGAYIGLRGAILLVGALVRRNRAGRAARIVGGLIAIAAGALAALAPDTTTDAVIVCATLGTIVVGAVMVAWGVRRAASGAPGLDPATATLPEVLWDWVRGSDIGERTREEYVDAIYFDPPGRNSKLAAWWVMLTLSVAIGTFAILADSTAVVIGAMLVAPLMTPIVGLAGAIVNGWSRRAVQSSIMVGLGVTVAVALAYGLAAWAPVAVAFETNSQITSRVNPTVIDMAIAVAAGAAGAFATVNKRVSASIAGVAIAVALVPPLAVVGICLGGSRFADAGGAFVLFLTNFAAIVLSAAVVFVLTGFAEPRRLRENPGKVVATLAPVVALAMALLIPLVLSSEGLLTRATQERAAQSAVTQWLGPDTEFAVQSITVQSITVQSAAPADASRETQVAVVVVGPGSPPTAATLRRILADELDQPVAVKLTVVPVTVTELPAR